MRIISELLLVAHALVGQVALQAVPAARIIQDSPTPADVNTLASPGDSSEFGIRLNNGDFASGEFAESGDLKEWISWKSPVFQDPISFSANAVESISFSRETRKDSQTIGDRISLTNGSTLEGKVVVITDKNVVLDVPGVGKIEINRDQVRRIVRIDKSNEVLFDGRQAAAWSLKNRWVEEGALLVTREPNALLSVNQPFPDQLLIELELAWEKECNFEFGISSLGPAVVPFAKLEVWDNQVVIVAERSKTATFEVVQKIPTTRSGHFFVQIYVDRKARRVIVVPANGENPISLDMPEESFLLSGDGFFLLNRQGHLQLHQFSVSSWSGESPVAIERNRSRILTKDGKLIYGGIKSYSADKLIVDQDNLEQTLSTANVREIVFPSTSSGTAGPWFISTTNGMTISGELQKIEQSKLWIKSDGIADSMGIPLTILTKLQHLKTRLPIKKAKGAEAQFVAKETNLRGVLADGEIKEPASLYFKPSYAKDRSPVLSSAAARIVYLSEAPTPNGNVRQKKVMQRIGAGGAVMSTTITRSNLIPTTSHTRAKETPHVVHLKSGDLIPCLVNTIDEKGLHLTTPVIKATFIPQDQVSAIEFMPDVAAIGLGKFKRERLLTVPRIQRDSPPTHLVRSVTGDYLRCRLLSMNEKSLDTEVRLESRSIPRDGVARIIWLQSTSTPEAESKNIPNETHERMIQAVYSNGNRLTFRPTKVEGMTIFGESSLLGTCEVKLNELNAVLIGPALDQVTTALPFQQWKLKAAADPLPSSSTDSENPEGRESALIGKPAPDFKLAQADGNEFHLAEMKGSIVVLDFWASWCGPCLQTMPQVEKVAKEFADKKVILVGVNLEESAAKVKAALERLELNLTVALDREGETAEMYGATAIPQTVIIDRRGNVSHVFVGANPRFDDILRDAIQGLVEKDSEQ